MKTVEQIAQWVIDNRYSKSENNKVSDSEMYHELVDSIAKLRTIPRVSGSLQPLTIDNVNKMLKKVSKETWIAVQGDENGFKEWYAERCKVNLNSNDR